MSRKSKQDTKKIGATHPGIRGTPYYKIMNLHELRVDPTYQRELKPHWIKEKSKPGVWSSYLCGVLIIAKRPDGSFYIVDGQQRAEAARTIGLKQLRCLIIEVDGVAATEAYLYVVYNNGRTSMKGFDLYKADLQIGTPDAVMVDKLVTDIGYRVCGPGQSGTKNSVTCVQKMREWARRNPNILERALHVCVEIYQGNRIDNRIVNGLCYLEDHLIKLQARGTGPEDSIVTAKNIRKLKKEGVDTIFQAMSSAARAYGKAANNVGGAQANGLIIVLNKCRHVSNKIPFINL